jgi:hypothetical protein
MATYFTYLPDMTGVAKGESTWHPQDQTPTDTGAGNSD